MMTFFEARKEVASRLREAGIENEAAESGFLLEYVTGSNSSFYLLHQMDPIPEDILSAYLQVTGERCSRKPLQYITGVQEFMGLDFQVNEAVLIPRQDTETLVEAAIKKIGTQEMDVLDMCAGSGCIAVSVKHYCPQISMTACDISLPALEVARENGKRNQADIRWTCSDLFDEVEGKYDMIISNPPYIPSAVIPTLMPEVRDHEPLSALDGTEDGLYFYEKITRIGKEYLRPSGWILYEIGFDQAESVSELLRKHGFTDIEILCDPAGLDRVVIGRRLENV